MKIRAHNPSRWSRTYPGGHKPAPTDLVQQALRRPVTRPTRA